ncbi:ribosome maturation factor RimP [Streptomyces spiramenti]|uniref:Ribosome maturation factor RimP n=1 Tax=Streptomyces spiramenti TaxID=2720606 RepID=A0ABX1AP86_9ACTN|nr:ribosome maturation factor RimP [Streptomyces spiramenti]NJP67951.1 ribosome maturation factor RimP [Streptomyces spiramenti]
MSTTQIDRLREMLEPLAAQHGIGLEDLSVTQAGKRRVLQLVVDTLEGDDGVSLDQCAELSRVVSERLDADDPLGSDAYVLEVTSPGADRPFTQRRHYLRARGRLARLRLQQGEELTVRILAVDEKGLDTEIPGEKGRKAKPRRVEFDDISSARGEVEFNRKADRDDDTEGSGSAGRSDEEA